LGCHLHDAKGPADHLPPGDGELDWDDLCPRLNKAPLKVIELRPGPSADEVAASARWLAGKFAQVPLPSESGTDKTTPNQRR
jgi:sugar phosphate isomerase/epimerase